MRQLRIGIDAQILGKQKGGAEVSVELLIRSLSITDPNNLYFVYVTDRHPFQDGDLPPNFQLRRYASAVPWAARLGLLPYYYFRDGLDVLYLQRATPVFGCRRTVLHIHDAMYATHPHLFPAWKRFILNWLFAWSGRKATAVITPTRASLEDIVREYGVDPAKIHIIPDTADRREVYVVDDASSVDAAVQAFGLRQPYVIYLGAMERNKNVHGLIEAFARFRVRRPEYTLALVGRYRAETRGRYVEALRRRVLELGLRDAVHFTGFVSNEHKRLLLNGARMLVFPSESEGLGLPPIEAMACGTPVIAGAIPSIEEYYGDALLTCPHDQTDLLAELMERLAADETLRTELIRKGFELVSRNPWDYKAPLMLRVITTAAMG